MAQLVDSKVNVEESVAPPVTPKIVEGSFCADGTRPRSTGGGWPLASRGCFELGSTQMAVVKGRGGGKTASSQRSVRRLVEES